MGMGLGEERYWGVKEELERDWTRGGEELGVFCGTGGVREDAMGVDSTAKEGDGEGEGEDEETSDSSPCQKEIQNVSSLLALESNQLGCHGILYGWSRMLGACSFLLFLFPPAFSPHFR